MKKGAEYEILIQRIFQDIIDQNEIKNVEVLRNVILNGKDYPHEIDIYWKFNVAGIEYETIIQAKDWSYPVTVGDLILFKGVLDDLPNQPRGLFITRSGYQTGALTVAQKNGILLYVLDDLKNEPIVVSILGFARGKILPQGVAVPGGAVVFIMELTIYEAVFEKLDLTIDQTVIIDNFKFSREEIVNKIALKEYCKTSEGYAIFYDENENEVTNQLKIQQTFVSTLRDENVSTKEILHTFDKPTFLKLLPDNTMLKVMRISTTATVKEVKKIQSYMKESGIALFVLKNLQDGNELMVSNSHKMQP